MNGIIGKAEHLKDLKLSRIDREELVRLNEESRLVELYEFIINRMNEYELSMHNGEFYCGLMEQNVTFNHVTCMLKNDVQENSGIEVTGSVVSKLVKLFLRALIECCEQDGVVELDAKDVLRRSAALNQRAQSGI